MKLIGVTGPIGSGKSTVASMLRDKGALVIDADKIARDAVEPGMPAWREIVERYGENILNPDKSINRRELGKVVFRDPEELKFLNQTIHPAVISEVGNQLKQIERDYGNNAVVVIDVPLLIEAGMHTGCDLVIVVTADRNIRLERLLKRGLSREEAESRISAQIDKDRLESEADIVINNNGTIGELNKEVDKLWDRIRSN